MSHSPLEYLRHILEEADYLSRQIENRGRAQFLQDETLKRAFVRSLEIIGEATKKMPDSFRQRYAHIEWRAIAGMRD